MRSHPYKSQPDDAFWSRAVSQGFDPRRLPLADGPLLRRGDMIVSAGSCFASHMIPWIERAGFTYVRTERLHPPFDGLPANLGYADFSAAYGNIYTTRHLRQLLERATGGFRPAEDRWYVGEQVIDPFRPGLRHPARSDAEFDLLTAQHLRAVVKAFTTATVFTFTLGLTEAWESTLDGAVYPSCPGTVGGSFDPERHRFHNFTVAEVRDDLLLFSERLRALNPRVRIVLSVSPVPLVATATDQHVLVATTYSKAVLRAAAGEVAATVPEVAYFPAYEIVTGPQAPSEFLADDLRNVSPAGIAAVMRTLLAASGLSEDLVARVIASKPSDGRKQDGRRPPAATAQGADAAAESRLELSRLIAEAECDELLLDI